jgi:hypothetical protein
MSSIPSEYIPKGFKVALKNGESYRYKGLDEASEKQWESEIGREEFDETVADAITHTIDSIKSGASEAFDTLKEVAEWISKHPSTGDFVALDNRVGNLEEILQDTQVEGTDQVIPGLVSVVNNLVTTSNDLSGRVGILETKATDASNAILQITSDLNDYKGVLAQHTTQITEINQRLTWQELYEEITA